MPLVEVGKAMRCKAIMMVVAVAGLVTATTGPGAAAAPNKDGKTGLCRAWAVHHRAGSTGRGSSDDATAFVRLSQLAGGARNVTAFCEGTAPSEEPVNRYQAQMLADGAAVYWSLDRSTNTGGVFTGVGPMASDLSASFGWAEGPELLAPPLPANASSLMTGPQGASTTCCSFAGPFSVSTWLQLPAGLTPAPVSGLVDVGNGTWTGFHLTYNSGDVQFVTSCGVGCESELRAPFAITPDVPTMIAASFDGTVGRIYANGALLGSAPMHAPAPAGAPYSIGAYHSLMGPYFPWPGYLDSVALFPVALSDAQIAQHFSIGSTAL
jgi:hypothetical protein